MQSFENVFFSTHYEDVLEPNQIRAFLLQRYFHFHPAKLWYYPLNEKLMIELINETGWVNWLVLISY